MHLLDHIGVALPWQTAISIYPIAMLAGAASMIPGGMGSTEVTIVGLLLAQGVNTTSATLAAVGIRITTLWLSILLGFLAIFTLTRYVVIVNTSGKTEQ